MTYNRPDYLRKLFTHLAKSDLSDILIIVIDDASNDPETVQLVQGFTISGIPIIKLFLLKHRQFNIHENLRITWDLLSEKYHCRNLAVLDSDVIVKPDWLTSIRTLHETAGKLYPVTVISGFDACVSHPADKNYSDYKVKRAMGGANMFFDTKLYRKFIRPCLVPYWDSILVEKFQKESYPFLVTRPSVIQHIGYKGLFGEGYWKHDFALNYSLRSAVFLFPPYVLQKTISAFRYYRQKLSERLR